jgi:hypothetical protein
MEDVLDLYAEAPDPKRPVVVCFDESPTQVIGEVRQSIPARPGQLERYDCEYKRDGTVNLLVFLDAHRPWRKVQVTEQRTARDFAQRMRELVDAHYPKAAQIRVMLDNQSTHAPGAHYEAFPACEAHHLLRRQMIAAQFVGRSVHRGRLRRVRNEWKLSVPLCVSTAVGDAILLAKSDRRFVDL